MPPLFALTNWPAGRNTLPKISLPTGRDGSEASSRPSIALREGRPETFLREAEEGRYVAEAIIARRILSSTYLYQGDLREARVLLDRAVADYVPNRDAQARFGLSNDTGVGWPIRAPTIIRWSKT